MIGTLPDEDRSGLSFDRDFLKLWGGETISQVGSQITILALPLTAIISLKASPQEVGMLTAAQFAPFLLVTLFAGVWLDSHRRRMALVVTSLGRAALLGLIPLLYLLDALTMPSLYLIAFVTGLLTAVADVAYLVYLPSLVSREELVQANSRLEATYSISQVGGPGLGGILVQAFTAPLAILADALSYLVAAVSFARIRRPEPHPSPAQPRHSTAGAIKQGLATTLRDPLLRPLVLQAGWFNLFEQALMTLYLLYGVRSLELSAGVLGLILATGSVGALAGSVLARWAGERFGVGPTIVGSMALTSAATALLPAAGGSAVAASLVLVTGFLLYGVGLAIFNVHSLTLRTHVVTPALLARVTATYRFVAYGTIPLGALLGGFLAEQTGIRTAMVIAVAALVAGAALFACSTVRRAGPVVQRTPTDASISA